MMFNPHIFPLRAMLFGALCMIPMNSFAQESPTRAEVCPKNDCRGAGTVRLRTKDGKNFSKEYEYAPPVLQDSLITVLAGESVNIEAERVGNQLTNLRVVPKNLHPEKTIVLRLEQMENRVAMLLTIFNPFKSLLKFEIGIQTLDRQAPIKVSSCPVPAAEEGFEGWPEPVFQVFLRNGHLLPNATREVDGCS